MLHAPSGTHHAGNEAGSGIMLHRSCHTVYRMCTVCRMVIGEHDVAYNPLSLFQTSETEVDTYNPNHRLLRQSHACPPIKACATLGRVAGCSPETLQFTHTHSGSGHPTVGVSILSERQPPCICSGSLLQHGLTAQPQQGSPPAQHVHLSPGRSATRPAPSP